MMKSNMPAMIIPGPTLAKSAVAPTQIYAQRSKKRLRPPFLSAMALKGGVIVTLKIMERASANPQRKSASLVPPATMVLKYTLYAIVTISVVKAEFAKSYMHQEKISRP